MKAFGRLLLATALIVPAGVMTAQSAGATPRPAATCTANTGTLHLSPGVRATDATKQTIKNFKSGGVNNPSADVGTVSGCTGIGIAESDGTGGTFAFSVKGQNVTCSSIRGKTLNGSGVIKWNAGESNAHVTTTLQVHLKFNSYLKVTFSGVVTSRYLKGTKLAGTATIPDTLKPVGVGTGACQNTRRVKSLDYTNDGDTTL